MLAAGAFVIAAIIGIIGYGYYASEVKPLHQPAVRVNSTIYNMGYYTNTLRILYAGGGTGLPPASLVDYTVQVIQQNELVKQKAAELGVEVDQEEIDKGISKRGFPNDREHRDMVAAELIMGKLREDYFAAKVPTMARQVHALAMVLEDEEKAREIRTRIEVGGNFTALAQEFSQEDITKAKGGDLGWLCQEYASIWFSSPAFESTAFALEVDELSEPIYDEAVEKNVGYWIIQVLEKKNGSEENASEQIHVQAILLGSRTDAEMVKSRLEAGEEFATLARELSQDPWSREEGGDLGWLGRGVRSESFDSVAFSLDSSVISDPVRDEAVRTTSGYWLIKVLEKDANRTIEKEHRDIMISKLLNDWVSQLWEDSKEQIESYIDEQKRDWALDRVISEKK